MTENEIAELEHATSLRLPATYRRLLASYPDFPNCAADPEFRPQDDGLFATKAQLWTVNVDDARYMREIFPPSFFVIGESGCGDYYAIDTTNSDAPVYISGPHEGEYPEDNDGNRLPSYASLTHYIDGICSEIDQWQGYQPEKRGLIHATIDHAASVAFLIFGLLFTVLFAAVVAPIWAVLRWLPGSTDRGGRQDG